MNSNYLLNPQKNVSSCIRLSNLVRKRDYDFYTQIQQQIPKIMKDSTSLKKD